MPTAAKRSTCSEALWVFVFFLSVFWLGNNGFDTSEASYHYEVAELFVSTGTIGFDEPREGVYTKGPDGRIYASHEFGNTALLIPTAAINLGLDRLLSQRGVAADRIQRLKQFVISFQAGLYSALTLTALYLVFRQYGMPVRRAFLGCFAVGFGTFFLNYSRNLFDGVLCGTLLTIAAYALLLYQTNHSLVLVGAAFTLLGLAVDTRLSMAVPTVAAFGFLFAAKTRRWEAIAVAMLALLPFAAWQLWYNHLRTGDYLTSPVQTSQYATNNALDGSLWVGVRGLLASPGKSLFVYSPLLLMSVFTMPRFWRRDRIMAGFICAVFLFWLLLHAKLRSWCGAWGWGPRHFITIVPLLAIPAVVSFETVSRRSWTRAAYYLLFASGFLLSSAGMIGNWHYRMLIAVQENRQYEDSVAWGTQNQAADMIYGAIHNFAVIAGTAEPEFVPLASEPNNFVSNRLNFWWYLLPHVGVPIWAVLVGVTMLGCIAVFSVRRILRDSA